MFEPNDINREYVPKNTQPSSPTSNITKGYYKRPFGSSNDLKTLRTDGICMLNTDVNKTHHGVDNERPYIQVYKTNKSNNLNYKNINKINSKS